MAASIIADIDVHDRPTFERYRQEVAPLVARFGGRYIVRGGELDVREGSFGFKRLIILEFPDMQSATAFYESPEYQPVMTLRLQSTASNVALIPGYEG